MIEQHDTPYTHRGKVLPEHLRESLILYAEEGRTVGSFLRAVLTNDLQESIAYADPESLEALPAVVGFVFNCLPGNCWGSREAYAAHIDLMGAKKP